MQTQVYMHTHTYMPFHIKHFKIYYTWFFIPIGITVFSQSPIESRLVKCIHYNSFLISISALPQIAPCRLKNVFVKSICWILYPLIGN